MPRFFIPSDHISAILITAINNFSPLRGSAIAEFLRSHGYGVTEVAGRGLSGTVTILHVGVMRKKLNEVETLVLEADPEAFVTVEEIRPLRRGYWGGVEIRNPRSKSGLSVLNLGTAIFSEGRCLVLLESPAVRGRIMTTE